MKRLLCLVSVLVLSCLTARAQECPGGQRMVVGLAAGGGLDGMARTLSERLNARFGRSIVVENRIGASGNIAAEHVARAPRDGCTLIIRGNEHNVNALIYARPGYEPKDFMPVLRVASGPAVLLAHPSQPFRTMAQFVAYAKTNPGRLAYGSSGIGGANHVAMELLLKTAGVQVQHVPYKGAALAVNDTVAGHLPLAMASVASSEAFVSAGKLVPLAVTSPTRWPTLPNVPTLAEAGYPDATYAYWNGILLPAGAPTAVRDKLAEELRAVLEEPALRERLLKVGSLPGGGSSADFDTFLQADERLSRRLVQDLQLKAE